LKNAGSDLVSRILLDHRPACRWRYHDSYVAGCEILLVLQILIGSEKNFEHLLGSEPKQIAVPGTTPTHLVNCHDCM
jgi:hypothetical protein